MSKAPSNRQIILDNHRTLDVVGHADDAVELGLLAGIFSALKQTLEGPARYFVLPGVLAMDCVRGIVALLNLINANNRNLNKYSKFILEIFKVGAIGTAIIGSLIGVVAIAAITPFLFIGALSLNALYHTAKCIFHGTKWVTATANDKFGKEHHKKEFTSNLVSTITGIVAVIAVTLLLAVRPELGIFKSIVSFGTAIALGASGLFSALQAYRARKIKEVNYDDKKVEDSTPTVAPAIRVEITLGNKNKLVNKTKAIVTNADILNLHHDDLIHYVLSRPFPLIKIKEMLEQKIDILQNVIDTMSFFQDHKRNIKADFLTHLHTILSGEVAFDKTENTLIASPAELIAFMEKHHKMRNVFGSFFTEVGEVQKLFLLGDAYFNKFKPEVKPKADDLMYGIPITPPPSTSDNDYRQTNGRVPALL
jgi:hypothetical protein